MHVATILTAFGTVFLAELPDKTMLATVVLSARYRRPVPVWVGAASALTLQMVIASAAGGLLALLPPAPVRFGVALLFAVGAVVLWRSAGEADEEAAAVAAEVAAAAPTATEWWRISPAVFGIVFVAEWGDLTQLATASLASGGRALSVFVGAAVAMVMVAGIGVLAGRALLRVMPERRLRQLAAMIFAGLAIVAAAAGVAELGRPTGETVVTPG